MNETVSKKRKLSNGCKKSSTDRRIVTDMRFVQMKGR